MIRITTLQVKNNYFNNLVSKDKQTSKEQKTLTIPMITIATAAMIMTRITSAYHASFISPKGIFTVSSQFTLLVVTIVDLLLIRSKFSVTQQARK